jgi:uncharacterized membrane protein YvbJ
MTKYISKSLLIGIFAFGFLSIANAQTKKSTAQLIEPTAKESIKKLMQNGNLLLNSYSSCKSYVADDTKTVGDYFANFLSFQATPGNDYVLDFQFKQEKAKNGDLIWVCDLVWRLKNEPDSSSDGFRFKMLNSDRKLISQSLMCIGVG